MQTKFSDCKHYKECMCIINVKADHKSEKNFHFMAQLGLLNDSWKPHSKIPKNHLSITFLGIFENESFSFSQSSQNFVLKKFPFYGTEVFLAVFQSISENCTKKYAKLASLQHFEVNVPGNLQKWKFSYFSNFVFRLITQFPRSRHVWIMHTSNMSIYKIKAPCKGK